MAGFVQPTCQGYLLLVHVVPGASRTEIAGLHGGRLKVRVAARPEKGAANRELLKFLARRLGLPSQALHGRLKVRVAARPEKGAANRELLKFLARRLGLPSQALQLTGGAASRAKTVAVHDLSPEVGERLRALWPADAGRLPGEEAP